MNQERDYESALHTSVEKIMMTVKYQSDFPILSDVCLFSSYSFSGIVEEYVYYYLSELQKAGLSIVFISTSPLTESCVSRLSQYAFLIIERENKCPDFGSWKAALSMLNWGDKMTSILLANDSVFGPLVDLSNIISSMNIRYDVWGMTDSYEVEYHLQSYFLYFNKAAIKSEVFTKFWKNVDLSASKEEVIFKYEIGLSSLLSRSNLKLGAYGSIDILSKTAGHAHKIVNPTLVFWKSLIKSHKFPFLKRELIIKMNISKTYMHVDLYVNVGNWKRMIEENSAYPISYISDFMNNYYKTIIASNSNIVLRKRKLLFISNNAEIGEAQRLLVNFLDWLKNETGIDVEIIINNDSTDELASEFSKFGIVTNFYALSESGKRNLKDRLIDEVALIFSNTIENLDTQKFLSFLDVPQIIFIHEPLSVLKDNLSINNNLEWVKNNVSQFIASSGVVKQNLVEHFGIDNKKVELIHKFLNPYSVEKNEKEHQKISGYYNNQSQLQIEIDLKPEIVKNNSTTAVQAPKILQLIKKYFDHEELMFLEQPLVTFMTHIYYENSWPEIRNKLKVFDTEKNYFLFSISEVCLIKEQIIEDIRKSFKNAFSLVTSITGKDIRGKMALIDLYLLLDIKTSYIVFLHDMQSPHSFGVDSSKNGPFKIIDPNNLKLILALFKDPKTGIVGAKDHIINEYNNATGTFSNNNQLSKNLNIHSGMSIENYDFSGGSMYWLKSSLIEKFFTKNHPILMRENLEAGIVLDHHEEKLVNTLERIFSRAATNEGLTIKGI